MSNLFFEHMFFVAVGSCIVTNHAAGSGTAFVAIEEFRIFVDDGGVVADGSTVVTDILQQSGSVEGRHHVVRVDGKDEVEVFDGKVVFSHIGTQKPSVVVPDEIRGLKVKGTVIVSHRIAIVVEVVVAEGTVDECVSLFGVETERFVKVLDGFVVLLMAHQNVGFSCMGTYVVFVRLDGFVNVSLSCSSVISLEKDLRFESVSVGLFCPSADDNVGNAVCLVEAVGLDVAESEVVPKGTVFGQHVSNGPVVSDSIRKTVHVDVGKPSQFVGVWEIRVALDGLGTVECGTGVIIKVELCHAPVEIGLIEVRFVVDDKVEVTDGEHIIIVRKGIATNVHHAVGVDLGMGDACQPPKWEGYHSNTDERDDG